MNIDTSCLNAGVNLVIESDYEDIAGKLLYGEMIWDVENIDTTGIMHIRCAETGAIVKVRGWLGIVVEVNGVSID